MVPAYNNAAAENGSGMFERMKQHVQSHVAANKRTMYDGSSNELISQLFLIEVRHYFCHGNNVLCAQNIY